MRVVRAVLPSFSLVLFLAARTAAALTHPGFDAVASGAPGFAVEARLARLRTDPALRALGTVTSTDDRLGVPTFVRATAAASATHVPADRAARDHLARLAPLYGLDATDATLAPLTNLHDTGHGPVIATFGQSIGGIPVFRDALKLLMSRDGALLAATGYIPGRTLGTRRDARTFRIGAAAAIAAALADFTGAPATAGTLHRQGALPGGYDAYSAPEGMSPIRVRKVWFHLPDELRAAYHLELVTADDACAYVVSATDGVILFRRDLVAADAYTYRVWASPTGVNTPMDYPSGDGATPHPTGLPDNYAPAFVSPNAITLQNGPISTNDPWLAPGSTTTVGNNVDAYADLAAPDGLSGSDFRATTTSVNTFDRTYNTAQDPQASAAQEMAAITQLFYTTNWMHDWYYDDGFDEASGNAQQSNYGRGGVGGDPLHAEAQDYSGTNNANMMTLADGGSPRMQMYVFTPGSAASLKEVSPSPATYAVGVATGFGPQAFNVSGTLVLATDGTAPTGDGCQAITNVVTGKIALVDRGTCTFAIKAQNAQSAGAIGLVIVDNTGASSPPGMGGSATGITIPVLQVTTAVGNSLKTQIAGGAVVVTLARGPSVRRDGTIDNTVVAHEWGHYISNRLIGDAGGLSTNQSSGMGEGWGDFHALLLEVHAGDDGVASNASWNGVYGEAGYATGNDGPGNSYYFGFRRYPYSADMNKNPLTFKHIDNSQPLPTGAAAQPNGNPNSEVHNTGEVWCTMLWECYSALLRDSGRLTFAQAQARMKSYLVAAYKLTPLAPTFTEARDALLAVAYANDPADHALFCQAFAKRGCGTGAVSPDRYSDTNAGVVESYVCGGDLAFASGSFTDEPSTCDHDGYIDNNETGRLQLTLRNVGATSLSSSSVTVSSGNPAISFPGGTTFPMPGSSPFGTTSVSIPVHMTGAPGLTTYDVQLSWNDPGFAVAGPRTGSLDTYGNADLVPSFTETFEEVAVPWTTGGNPVLPAYAWTRTEVTPTDHRYAAPDPGGISDQWLVTPPLQVGSGAFSLQFQHRYEFEFTTDPIYYDGGVIELSQDGGATWSDIGASASPGYGGVVFTGADNPLSGRQAFVGPSPSYPSRSTVTVSLGTTYAGKTVLVRFRIGSDQASSDFGWEIDDVQATGLVSAPFTSLVGDPSPCPLAVDDAGAPGGVAFAIASAQPVLGTARFEFALPAAGRARIDVFDLSGRLAATLAEGEFAPGRHAVAWSSGASRNPGVYFARLSYQGRELRQRVVVLR